MLDLRDTCVHVSIRDKHIFSFSSKLSNTVKAMWWWSNLKVRHLYFLIEISNIDINKIWQVVAKKPQPLNFT